MPEVSVHAPGTFCWIDLGTSDAGAAKDFYSRIFGWECEDSPLPGETGSYTMLRRNGRDVGGLYQITGEQAERGVPPHWMSYVAVENVDTSTNQAESLGAEVLAGPMDVLDVGRMSTLRDPAGAVFSLWQAKAHPGFGVTGEPGSPCWFELMTRDVPGAKAFYSGLFGYRTEDHPMGESKYTMFVRGDTREAGMMAITPEMGEVPPHWMIYFTVDDCDGTVENVQSRGGKIYVPPTDIPEIGRFSTLADPQGAAFSVIRLSHPA